MRCDALWRGLAGKIFKLLLEFAGCCWNMLEIVGICWTGASESGIFPHLPNCPHISLHLPTTPFLQLDMIGEALYTYFFGCYHVWINLDDLEQLIVQNIQGAFWNCMEINLGYVHMSHRQGYVLAIGFFRRVFALVETNLGYMHMLHTQGYVLAISYRQVVSGGFSRGGLSCSLSSLWMFVVDQ